MLDNQQNNILNSNLYYYEKTIFITIGNAGAPRWRGLRTATNCNGKREHWKHGW